MVPVGDSRVEDLAQAPQSVSQPIGWKALLELGPHEVDIATKSLVRLPRCQTAGIRFPMGIEGTIVGRSVLLTDPQLRAFSVDRHWGAQTTRETGAQAFGAWNFESRTPHWAAPRHRATPGE